MYNLNTKKAKHLNFGVFLSDGQYICPSKLGFVALKDDTEYYLLLHNDRIIEAVEV